MVAVLRNRSRRAKANLAKFLKRVPLSKRQVHRLENVLLKIVDEITTEEFRSYCRLARIIATLALREALKKTSARREYSSQAQSDMDVFLQPHLAF